MGSSDRRKAVAPKKVTKEPELGCKEVAELIGMSRQWVQKAAAENRLPGYRLSPEGHFRFERSDIERWYERQTGRPLGRREAP